jgi:uncharacterized membrane protein YjfL (UPF0719 family)
MLFNLQALLVLPVATGCILAALIGIRAMLGKQPRARSDQPAMLLVRGGEVLAACLLGGATATAGGSTWSDVAVGTLASAALCIAAQLLATGVGLGLLLGRNLAAELTKGNTAVGIVAAGYDVAVALIVSQSLAGSTQNELVPNLAFCALGFAALLALVAVLRALTPWDDAAQLRSANSAAALAHAGMTLAVGLLVSHATSGAFDGWTASLRAFGEVVAFALLLVPIRIGIVQGILLGGGLRWRGGPLDQLVGEQRHTGVAALEAAALVGGALALRAVVG